MAENDTIKPPEKKTTADEIKRHIRRTLKALEAERQDWEPLWKDLSRFFQPKRARFTEKGDRTNSGLDKRNPHLWDSVGLGAVRVLASGMHSSLTNPTMTWFTLAFKDKHNTNNYEAKVWLDQMNLTIVEVLRSSNFYDNIFTLYVELAVFGTAVMLVERDRQDKIRFKTLTSGEYYLDCDSRGRVNSLYRRVQMNAHQIVEDYPDTAPEYIKSAAERDDLQWFSVIHAVEPNPEAQKDQPNRKIRPYRSIYMMEKDSTILDWSGYYEFPALCPRWETTGSDVYGNSPAMEAICDNKSIQRMKRTGIKQLEYEANPPIIIESPGLEEVDMTPGGVTYVQPGAGARPGMYPMWQIRSNLLGNAQAIEEFKKQVRDAFFTDMFIMMVDTDKTMTATEVMARNSEKMLMLGPVLFRMRSEFFQPLITRIMGILDRDGWIPFAPPSIQGQELDIEFISMLAQAAQTERLKAINELVMIVGQLAPLDPSIRHKVNLAAFVDEFARVRGVPPTLITPDEVYQALKQQDQQQQQMMQQMAAVQSGAASAKDGAAAMEMASRIGETGEQNAPVQ